MSVNGVNFTKKLVNFLCSMLIFLTTSPNDLNFKPTANFAVGY